MAETKRWTNETREEQRLRMKATQRWLTSMRNKPGPRRRFSHEALHDALAHFLPAPVKA